MAATVNGFIHSSVLISVSYFVASCSQELSKQSFRHMQYHRVLIVSQMSPLSEEWAGAVGTPVFLV